MAKCLLCNSSEQDEVAYGEFLKKDETIVHEFCLYLSSGLVQNGNDNEGFYGFLPADIRNESERVRQLYCCFCHQNYANIGCCESKCRKTFHMICGIKNGVENQFTGTFKSYCEKHARKRDKRPPIKEICCICYDSLRVEGVRNYYKDFIRAPCCQNGWFHRCCLQGFARSAGYFFKCPLCNDTDRFRKRVPYLGIFIRNADASWELEPNAFAELLHRPNNCEAEICRNRKGRDYVNSENNPILCCETCGAVGIHRLCLPTKNEIFNCAECLQMTASRPSNSEGDSGRESIQVGASGDEDEEVDVCNISDSDDIIRPTHSLKMHNRIIDLEDISITSNEKSSAFVESSNTLQEFTDEDVPLTSKLKKQFLYDSTDDEGSSVELISCYNLNIRNRNSSVGKLNRKRKIVNISSDTSDRCSPVSEVTASENDSDDETDVLDNIDRLMKKKQKIEENDETTNKHFSNNSIKSSLALMSTCASETHHDQKQEIVNISNSKSDRYLSANEISVDRSGLGNEIDPLDELDIIFKKERDLVLQTSPCVSQIYQDPYEIKRQLNHESISKNGVRSDDSTPRKIAQTTEHFANKENDHGFQETDFCASNETHTKKNPLEVSCIANRTRRRKSLNVKSGTKNNAESCVNENNDNRTSGTKRRYTSDSNADSVNSTNENEKKASPLDVSCIAKRTRRKTVGSFNNNLDTVAEKSASEFNDKLQTSNDSKKCEYERLIASCHSKDDGFSSDSQSSFATKYSISQKKLNRVYKKRFRLISVTSDEEFNENDKLKNR